MGFLGVHGQLEPLQDTEPDGTISILVKGLERPEHGFEPDQTADEAVEVDVHALVCVAHGDDVVELVVETEACIIDSIPHLVTVDTGLVGVIVFKNSLPLFDLIPQVSELLKVESTGPIHVHQSNHAPAALQAETLRLQVLVLGDHSVENVSQFVGCYFHILAAYLLKNSPEQIGRAHV